MSKSEDEIFNDPKFLEMQKGMNEGWDLLDLKSDRLIYTPQGDVRGSVKLISGLILTLSIFSSPLFAAPVFAAFTLRILVGAAQIYVRHRKEQELGLPNNRLIEEYQKQKKKVTTMSDEDLRRMGYEIGLEYRFWRPTPKP